MCFSRQVCTNLTVCGELIVLPPRPFAVGAYNGNDNLISASGRLTAGQWCAPIQQGSFGVCMVDVCKITNTPETSLAALVDAFLYQCWWFSH